MDPFSKFHAGIEQAAIKANNDKDAASVHDLANEVFNFRASFAHLPAIVEMPLKAVLEKAELEYLHGRSKGIDADDFIAFHNEIVTKMGAPDYSKIDRYQLEVTRTSLAKREPNFIGKDSRNGQEINRNLSPLEAAHMFQFIVEQKLTNPYWQIPPGQEFRKFDRNNPQEQSDQGFFQALIKSPLGAFDYPTVLQHAKRLIS